MLTDEVCFIVNLSLWAMVNLFSHLEAAKPPDPLRFEPPPPTDTALPKKVKRDTADEPCVDGVPEEASDQLVWLANDSPETTVSVCTDEATKRVTNVVAHDATGTAPSLVHLSSR